MDLRQDAESLSWRAKQVHFSFGVNPLMTSCFEICHTMRAFRCCFMEEIHKQHDLSTKGAPCLLLDAPTLPELVLRRQTECLSVCVSDGPTDRTSICLCL